MKGCLAPHTSIFRARMDRREILGLNGEQEGNITNSPGPS